MLTIETHSKEDKTVVYCSNVIDCYMLLSLLRVVIEYLISKLAVAMLLSICGDMQYNSITLFCGVTVNPSRKGATTYLSK